MTNLQIVQRDDLPVQTASSALFPGRAAVQWIVAIVAFFGLGTWLVWWAASVQRTLIMDDIRSACEHVMPETVERCVDTVIIQRGGARR